MLRYALDVFEVYFEVFEASVQGYPKTPLSSLMADIHLAMYGISLCG